MEITATPRRRGPGPLRLLVAAAALLSLGLLGPAAFGFEPHAVTTDAGGTYARGWLVLDEQVAVEELAVGDVVTDPLTGGRLAARTVLERDGELYVSGGEPDAAHRLVGTRQQRVVAALPWLGYPALLPLGVLVLLGVVVALALAARFGPAIGHRRDGRRDRSDPSGRPADAPTTGTRATAAAG